MKSLEIERARVDELLKMVANQGRTPAVGYETWADKRRRLEAESRRQFLDKAES